MGIVGNNLSFIAYLLKIVGKGLKGGEEKRLHQEVKKRQLTNHIRFLGYIFPERKPLIIAIMTKKSVP